MESCDLHFGKIEDSLIRMIVFLEGSINGTLVKLVLCQIIPCLIGLHKNIIPVDSAFRKKIVVISFEIILPFFTVVYTAQTWLDWRSVTHLLIPVKQYLDKIHHLVGKKLLKNCR